LGKRKERANEFLLTGGVAQTKKKEPQKRKKKG